MRSPRRERRYKGRAKKARLPGRGGAIDSPADRPDPYRNDPRAGLIDNLTNPPRR